MPAGEPFIPPFSFGEHVVALWTPEAAHSTSITILMAVFVAVACGWIGCYLILQGMALLGDAISHTVLLGIVVAFLLTGQVSGIAIFVAAAITGIATTVLIDGLHRASRLKEDAAIGIVFTSLFALGVVLLSTFASRAHIDTQHVLYGDLAFVGSRESVSIFGRSIPVVVCQMAVVVAVLLSLIAVFYKELLVTAFDPQLAASLGLRPNLVRYGLLAILSLTVVGAFTSVGAVFVVGMLIAPAATAYLLSVRLSAMFAWAAISAILSSIIGYHVAYWLAVSVSGAIVVCACGLFVVALFLAPEQGLLAAALRRARRRLRTSQENIIRQLLKLSAGGLETAALASDVARSLQISNPLFSWATRELVHRDWVTVLREGSRRLMLTPRGLAQAQRLDRAHRLWETFLVDQVGLPSDHVHVDAEELEHALSEQLVERLDDALGHPDIDPHGAPIPRSSVSDVAPGLFTLSKLRVGESGTLVGLANQTSSATASPHVPAEPIAALDLPLGRRIRVAERNVGARTWTIEIEGGQRLVLTHELADSLLVHAE